MAYHDPNLGVTTLDEALPGSIKKPRPGRVLKPTDPTQLTSAARLKELAGMDPALYESIYGDPNAYWRKALAEIASGNSGSRSSGPSGPSASDKLAREQFNYGKQQDALTRAQALEELQFGRNRDARIAGGYSDFYDGGQGQYNQGFGNLLSMITNQGEVSSDAVGKAYDRAMTGINQGYSAAQGVGDEGFRALNAYLGANPNNPYANMRAQVGSAPDAMSQYLGAYGVSDMPVQGQIQADQLQAQQGAGNFQNLIDVLSGVAQQGAASRGAESQMAQNFFNTTLGQDRAGYRGQAENAQAQALAALQQRMFDSQFGVEEDRNALGNELAQKILDVGGDVNGDGDDGDDDDVVTKTDPIVTAPVLPPTQTRAQKVTAAPTTYASFKEAAKVLSPKAVAKYTADGSGLNAKEVKALKKQFPALAKVFETAKKKKKK